MNDRVKRIVFFGIMLGIGYTLPFLTMSIPELGTLLLPMHYPVILTGYVLGPVYGLALGLILPITRSLIFGSPIMYPMAVSMSFELLTYGFVSGFIYETLNKTKLRLPLKIIFSLIISMILGRIAYGIILLVLGIYPLNKEFIPILINLTIIKSLPGIIIELSLLPLLVLTLEKTNLIKKFKK